LRTSAARFVFGSSAWLSFLGQQRPPASSAHSFENLITQGGAALIELLFGEADCVRYVRYQANWESAYRAEGEKRSRLHLNCQSSGLGVKFELFLGLPIGSIRGPNQTG